MKKSYTLLLWFMSSMLGIAQEVNYSEHIAPIIYEHCTNCHRTGEIGPMPFTNYEEVSAWGGMIEYVTDIRYMPPWKADPSYSNFLGETYLKNEEIQLIKDWVAAGMPQGDPALEPDVPVFPLGSQVGEPDVILSFAQAFEHYGGNEDQYRVFVLPTGFTEDKEIATVELRPGNTKIVHHALFSYDLTGEAQQLDAEDPGYGYDGFGGFGVQGTFTRQLPGYVPGQKPRLYPEGTGQMIPAGADLLVQMHYAPVPFPEIDSSTINIFFKEEPVQRYVQNHIMLPFFGTLENGPFIMPPNEVKTFHGIWEVEEDISLISIAPHMHLLGQSWEVFAVSPIGDTTNLIRINEWDFNWQGGFHFDRFIVLAAGTQVHAFATYDNTENNPFNPSSPPQMVSWGEKTTDEMYYLPFAYVPYMEGDEDVVFEDDVISSTASEVFLVHAEDKLYPVFPNPSSHQIIAGFSLQTGAKIDLEIRDMQGKIVKTIAKQAFYLPGQHKIEINLPELSNGIYVLSLKSKRFAKTEKFVLNH